MRLQLLGIVRFYRVSDFPARLELRPMRGPAISDWTEQKIPNIPCKVPNFICKILNRDGGFLNSFPVPNVVDLSCVLSFERIALVL